MRDSWTCERDIGAIGASEPFKVCTEVQTFIRCCAAQHARVWSISARLLAEFTSITNKAGEGIRTERSEVPIPVAVRRTAALTSRSEGHRLVPEKMEDGSRLSCGACKGRWKVLIRSEGCGLVLRSPHDTEPDDFEEVVGREVVEALRRAAAVGVVAPAAAAQQTVRTSRRSCGVGHAS